MLYLFSVCFACDWATFLSTQVSLLGWIGVIPGRAQVARCGAVDNIWVGCVQGKCFNHCNSSLAILYIIYINYECVSSIKNVLWESNWLLVIKSKHPLGAGEIA